MHSCCWILLNVSLSFKIVWLFIFFVNFHFYRINCQMIFSPIIVFKFLIFNWILFQHPCKKYDNIHQALLSYDCLWFSCKYRIGTEIKTTAADVDLSLAIATFSWCVCMKRLQDLENKIEIISVAVAIITFDNFFKPLGES